MPPPDLFRDSTLLKPVKGVLLYGPPGTGKTMLAKALAKESDCCFINIRPSALQSKWFGDAQKLVAAVFSVAEKLQPSIIYIDEMDSMLGKRRMQEHDATQSMKTEFMSSWDGITTDQTAQVMVLGSTNRPNDLDEAILRRLPETFEVGLPDFSSRKLILNVILRTEVKSSKELAGMCDAVAAATEGFSGSDLQHLCTSAAFYPVRETLEKEEKEKKQGRKRNKQKEKVRQLRLEDLQQALREFKGTHGVVY